MLFLQKEGFCSEEKTLRDETLISSEESIKKESKTQFGLKVKTDPKGGRAPRFFLPYRQIVYVISEGKNMKAKQMAIYIDK